MTRGTLYDIPAGTVYVHVLYMLVHLSVHLIKRGRKGESVCVCTILTILRNVTSDSGRTGCN